MRKLFLLGCFVLLTSIYFSNAIAKEVMINPITSSIREELKQSTTLISKVEESMAPKINALSEIYTTYENTCKDNPTDKGCIELQSQVADKYKEVLETINNQLPNVIKSIESTSKNLGQSIKKKTRNKDIQQLLTGVNNKTRLPKVRGPLSKKLTELLKAMGRPISSVSILELSLRTQVDLLSANEILEYLDAEVNRQLIMVDMTKSLGDLSPEMASVMRGVSEIFGYDSTFEIDQEELNQKPDDWNN